MAAAGLRWIVDIMNHGEAWPSALKGHQALDAVGQDESKKAMML